MMKPKLYQKVCSYLYPLHMRSGSSAVNPVLELFLYCNQWQLATADALYSDGRRYRPLRLAFKKLKPRLAGVHTALVLGAGLGSALRILDRLDCRPETTLLDWDKMVLQWALELLPEALAPYVKPVCADARAFITEDSHTYDLLVVDVFSGREPAGFVREEAFVQDCHKRLNPGGMLVLNYIAENPEDWPAVRHAYEAIFGPAEVLDLGPNRVLMATA